MDFAKEKIGVKNYIAHVRRYGSDRLAQKKF